MTTFRRRDIGDREFERKLKKALKHSPVACGLAIYPSYDMLVGKQIWNPYPPAEAIDGKHLMLLVAYGKDKNGQYFFEFQDSNGTDVGHRGYVRVAADSPVITDFVVIELI